LGREKKDENFKLSFLSLAGGKKKERRALARIVGEKKEGGMFAFTPIQKGEGRRGVR